MRVLFAALLAAAALVVADEHFQDELPPGDGRDPRQVEFSISFDDDDAESGRGFGDSPEADGFFSGNPLPRPPGLVSLGDLDDPPPSGGFEPDPPVGGPSPFTIPELSAPFVGHFAGLPGFPPPRSPAQSSGRASPPSPPRPPEAKEAPLRAVGSPQEGRPRARRPIRRPHRFRRPFAGGARPFRPQRESVAVNSLEDDVGPAFVGSGVPVRGNVYRGREDGVMGFLESFRRLIRRII
ncbi:proline-rich protein HaeIII subfamily 1-like [Penaeus indicus]|uniref:proline-rich protein HaeIII subfamily 1-like n=1 Tax=Penaeus indicus TaxID=29960 RepID=UPI00300CDF3F